MYLTSDLGMPIKSNILIQTLKKAISETVFYTLSCVGGWEVCQRIYLLGLQNFQILDTPLSYIKMKSFNLIRN